MTPLLPDLLAAGLIEKMDGDDQRYAKLEKAAATLAERFQERPADLIRAILAGLDPDIPAQDPIIQLAKQALQAEWRTMSGVYADEPIGLYRALLFEACHQCNEGTNAAILWLTAADTLPLYRLGSEVSVVSGLLKEVAVCSEETALTETIESEAVSATAQEPAAYSGTLAKRKLDRENLLQKVGAAAGPNHRGTAPANPNPHWSNQQQHWSWEFTDRMAPLLADEFDALSAEVAKDQGRLASWVSARIKAQMEWVLAALANNDTGHRTEQLRLDALWWSEALYSPSLHNSYRQLPAPLACVLMAIDLLDLSTLPTPASIGHLLAESVNRLPGAGYEKKQRLTLLLTALREHRNQLPEGMADRFPPPPSEGRLSLRDLLVLTLSDKEWNADDALQRAGLGDELELSLPDLAHALFRQEQAVRLAELEE